MPAVHKPLPPEVITFWLDRVRVEGLRPGLEQAAAGRGKSLQAAKSYLHRYHTAEYRQAQDDYLKTKVAPRAVPPTPTTNPKGIDNILTLPPAPFAVRIPAPAIATSKNRGFSAVVYGDTHVPFHDPSAVKVVQAIVKDVQPNVLLDVGDLVDAWQISRFDKDPSRKDSLQDNIDEARHHLYEMSALAPKSRRVLLEGNHEARLGAAIWKMEGAARELPKLRAFQQTMTWPVLLELDAIGWEWVPGREQSKTQVLPKIITKHGTVVRKWSGATARGEWEKYGASGLSGHTHRLGHFMHRDHNGTASWIETGCCCLLDPPYGVDFDWAQGCVVLTWNADRRLMATEMVSIRDGSALWRDKEWVS